MLSVCTHATQPTGQNINVAMAATHKSSGTEIACRQDDDDDDDGRVCI